MAAHRLLVCSWDTSLLTRRASRTDPDVDTVEGVASGVEELDVLWILPVMDDVGDKVVLIDVGR